MNQIESMLIHLAYQHDDYRCTCEIYASRDGGRYDGNVGLHIIDYVGFFLLKLCYLIIPPFPYVVLNEHDWNIPAEEERL